MSLWVSKTGIVHSIIISCWCKKISFCKRYGLTTAYMACRTNCQTQYPSYHILRKTSKYFHCGGGNYFVVGENHLKHFEDSNIMINSIQWICEKNRYVYLLGVNTFSNNKCAKVNQGKCYLKYLNKMYQQYMGKLQCYSSCSILNIILSFNPWIAE